MLTRIWFKILQNHACLDPGWARLVGIRKLPVHPAISSMPKKTAVYDGYNRQGSAYTNYDNGDVLHFSRVDAHFVEVDWNIRLAPFVKC